MIQYKNGKCSFNAVKDCYLYFENSRNVFSLFQIWHTSYFSGLDPSVWHDEKCLRHYWWWKKNTLLHKLHTLCSPCFFTFFSGFGFQNQMCWWAIHTNDHSCTSYSKTSESCVYIYKQNEPWKSKKVHLKPALFCAKKCEKHSERQKAMHQVTGMMLVFSDLYWSILNELIYPDQCLLIQDLRQERSEEFFF